MLHSVTPLQLATYPTTHFDYILFHILHVYLPHLMGSHTIKGANNSLYGDDPVQNPYSTRFPVEYSNQNQ